MFLSAYDNYSPRTLEKIWITYQSCLIKTLEHDGKNNSNIPHMKKDALARENRLPPTLTIPIELVNQARATVRDAEMDHSDSESSQEL